MKKYAIWTDTVPLYIAGDNEYCVTNATLTEALNDAGTLTFSIPPTNPNYNVISERVKVIVYEGSDIRWRGFVIETNKNFRNELAVTCVGELAYLNDTIQPQAKYQGMTPTQLFTAYLSEHNAQSSETFTVGMVTVTDPNDNVYRFTDYETTLTALRDDLCESLQGYLRIRWDNGVRKLDLVRIEDYGTANGQIIEFGVNLLDYAEGMNASDIATACLPLGAAQEETEVDGLTKYLDIKSVNNDIDYVQDDTAVASLGLIKRVVHWENVTVPATLKQKALDWLTTAQFSTLSLQIKAVEMSKVGVYIAPKRWLDFTIEEWNDLGMRWRDLGEQSGDIDRFHVGDRVRCFAPPYGMDATYPVQEKVTYLQDPTQNEITLSTTKAKTYTQMQATAQAQQQKENQTVLASAVSMATEIMTNANEGNVYIKYGADGKAEELCIMDTDSPQTATKVWRWNLNGFGYSSNGYNGPYTTAITMDGGIVADFITTGTLTLGGSNDNTILEIYDSSATNIGSWNKNGLKATKGSIGKWDINKDSQDGLTANCLASDGYMRRVYIQPYNNAYGGSTWIFSLQKANQTGENPTSFSSVFTLFGNGSAYFDDAITAGTLTAASGKIGLNSDGSIHCGTNTSAYSGYQLSVIGKAGATAWDVLSDKKIKQNIKPFKTAIDKVKESDIYTYKLKDEVKEESKSARQHIGMVIGDGYNVPDEIVTDISTEKEDGTVETFKGIDLYAMCSMLWKAVQELSDEVEELRGGTK